MEHNNYKRDYTQQQYLMELLLPSRAMYLNTIALDSACTITLAPTQFLNYVY